METRRSRKSQAPRRIQGKKGKAIRLSAMKDQPAPQSRSDNGSDAKEKGENKICRSGLQGWGRRKEKAWGHASQSQSGGVGKSDTSRLIPSQHPAQPVPMVRQRREEVGMIQNFFYSCACDVWFSERPIHRYFFYTVVHG